MPSTNHFFDMRTYKIHLIRHGEYEGAEEGRYVGHTDLPLSEEGRAEALQLKEDEIYPKAASVFTSPLIRCRQTAEILYPDAEAVDMPGFIECNFGEFENMTAADLRDNEDFAGWLAGKNAPPFGESSADFGKRVCSCFETLADGMMKSGVFDVAVITHAGVIAALLSAYGLPQAPMHEWRTPYCCGYTLLLDPTVWMRGKKAEVFALIPESRD